MNSMVLRKLESKPDEHILITDLEGNPNIGAYGLATDKYVLVGNNVDSKLAEKIESVLKVPVHRIKVAGTNLIGVFCAANNRKLLVPQIIFDSERKKLEDLKIDYKIIKSDLTALGNNILCNDNGAVINPNYTDEEAKSIGLALGVNVIKMGIGKTEVPGSCAAVTNKFCVIHRDASEDEIQKIEKLLRVKVETGSVNLGIPYIRMAVINNSYGMIVSKMTTGPEINNLDIGLGYLER